MAKIVHMGCSRCGEAFNITAVEAKTRDWFLNGSHAWCHCCTDGSIGSKTELKGDLPEYPELKRPPPKPAKIGYLDPYPAQVTKCPVCGEILVLDSISARPAEKQCCTICQIERVVAIAANPASPPFAWKPLIGPDGSTIVGSNRMVPSLTGWDMPTEWVNSEPVMPAARAGHFLNGSLIADCHCGCHDMRAYAPCETATVVHPRGVPARIVEPISVDLVFECPDCGRKDLYSKAKDQLVYIWFYAYAPTKWDLDVISKPEYRGRTFMADPAPAYCSDHGDSIKDVGTYSYEGSSVLMDHSSKHAAKIASLAERLRDALANPKVEMDVNPKQPTREEKVRKQFTEFVKETGPNFNNGVTAATWRGKSIFSGKQYKAAGPSASNSEWLAESQRLLKADKIYLSRHDGKYYYMPDMPVEKEPLFTREQMKAFRVANNPALMIPAGAAVFHDSKTGQVTT